jgi:hypothetical protein
MEGMLEREAAIVWQRLSPDSDRERESLFYLGSGGERGRERVRERERERGREGGREGGRGRERA